VPQADITCPFCGEPFGVSLDETEGRQTLITDCEVCCRPMTVTAEISGAEIQWTDVAPE